MTDEFKTVELARVYENQGWHKEALDIYQYLEAEAEDTTLKSDMAQACLRIKAALEAGPAGNPEAGVPENRMEDLLEQWVKLLILEKRLEMFEKIRARF